MDVLVCWSYYMGLAAKNDAMALVNASMPVISFIVAP